ncbi:MAG TPA: helix-turn-helix transcriptional regulator [Terriglobales bacterium]|nr:helix-turn-helix transcriptional regulator [Terriglobales bacterium]
MQGTVLKNARLRKEWTQQEAAVALGVTQAYLSMLEKGRREVPDRLVLKAQRVLSLPPTSLPLLPEPETVTRTTKELDWARELGALGYPAFSYQPARALHNPAFVLFAALNEPDLDSRVAEGLPWLAWTYADDLDWKWLVRNAKLHDRQNRLGFTVSLAREVAQARDDKQRTKTLQQFAQLVEVSRLAREDTYCHDSMTEAEREWLRQSRSSLAKHWNLLTDLKGEQLAYASR